MTNKEVINALTKMLEHGNYTLYEMDVFRSALRILKALADIIEE